MYFTRFVKKKNVTLLIHFVFHLQHFSKEVLLYCQMEKKTFWFVCDDWGTTTIVTFESIFNFETVKYIRVKEKLTFKIHKLGYFYKRELHKVLKLKEQKKTRSE